MYRLAIVIIIIMWVRMIIKIIKQIKGQNDKFMPTSRKANVRKFK